MKVTLTKISIKAGEASYVPPSYSATGLLYGGVVGSIPVEIDVADIAVGACLFVFQHAYNYIKTSPIKMIIRNENGSLDIETETSVYNLSTVENEE